MSDREISIVEKMKSGSVDFNDTKISAAYALNLCTVSVSQIIDYNDVVVLEQEYETILNNLNIEKMPKDEALLKILKQLLDTITFFRIQEGDRKFIDREYQNKMKNAIWSAVPNLGLIVAGGDPVTLAVSLVSQIGIGYMNYRKEKSANALAHEKSMWQLQRAAIEQFNGLRRELFDTAWRLVDAHELPDEYRLTERQVKQYNEILMDPDDFRRYERLDTIKGNFVAYPQFWYFFGTTANALSRGAEPEMAAFYCEAAKTYYDIFVRSFKACSLLRENSIASACALEYIDLLKIDDPAERAKIEELLSFAIKMSGNANDVLQLCAFAYLKIGNIKNAAVLFRRLVNEDYNTIVNAQLLSGYYVSAYLSGDSAAKSGYGSLKDRIDEAYLFPFPENVLPACEGAGQLAVIQNDFICNQKEILTKKFGLVINRFQQKTKISFNHCVPVPDEKQDTDAYFDGSTNSFAARKADGVALRNKKVLSAYLSKLQECDFPYNYLLALNDMLNAVSALDCVQGHEATLLSCVSDAIIHKRSFLKEIRARIDDISRFGIDTYNEMIEISFDDYTKVFFEHLATYSSEYIELKNDIVSMNEAEMNLREFCLQQGLDTPDTLYETAHDIVRYSQTKRQYLGIELIDDGVLLSVVNDRYDEVKKAICKYADSICVNHDTCSMVISGNEEFDRYFIRLEIPNGRDIRRKTVAVFDDNSAKSHDLLFTTEGIVQIMKGKMKEIVPYDEIELTADRSAILLHQSYSNPNISIESFIQLILSLRTKPFAEGKEKKNPFDHIMEIIKKG
ncbi:MAG: hypothetical protein RSE43_10655 [Oscillospiraceae bacterium]